MTLGPLCSAGVSVKYDNISRTLSEEPACHILGLALILLALFHFISGEDVFLSLTRQTHTAEIMLTGFSGTHNYPSCLHLQAPWPLLSFPCLLLCMQRPSRTVC